MKLVFTHPNPLVVAQAESAIRAAGIEVTLRNEYAMGAVGELAPFDTWQEVWVLRDRDFDRARAVVSELTEARSLGERTCAACGTTSPSTFEVCWQCGAALAAEETTP
jgi:hypothetical protein